MKSNAQQITKGKIGEEGAPIVIIDNFCPFADALVQSAQSRPFSVDNYYYPGYRSAAPNQYKQLLSDTLHNQLIEYLTGENSGIKSLDAKFALINKPPETLELMQKIPHYDVPGKNALACVHYLCSPHYGGTSFYKHISTGFEFVDANREEPYLHALEVDLKRHGLPTPPQYINGDTDIFKRIASVEAVYNRTVIYRAFSLHSGNIQQDHNYSLDPQTGRLTVTSFILLN